MAPSDVDSRGEMTMAIMAQVALAWSTTHRRSKAPWAACHSFGPALGRPENRCWKRSIQHTVLVWSVRWGACHFLGLDWSLGESIHVRYSQIFSSNVSLTRLKSKVVFIVATMRWHGIMIPVSSRSFRDQHCRGWWQSCGDHRSWGISFALLASICLHVPCLDPTSQTFQQFQEAQLVGDSMGLHNTIYWDAIYIWQYSCFSHSSSSQYSLVLEQVQQVSLFMVSSDNHQLLFSIRTIGGHVRPAGKSAH